MTETEAKKKNILIVFDFDWSFINENTDTYVIEQLAPQLLDKFNLKRKEMPWTSLMNYMVQKMMAEHNVTKLQLET